jgi:L-lactate dehydrogenase complex protein LldG
MRSREHILSAIRANRPKVDRPLPEVPLFDEGQPGALLATFKSSLERMGGLFLDPPLGGDALRPVRSKGDMRGGAGTRWQSRGCRGPFSRRACRRRLRDCAGLFAVAETGSVLLSERDLGVNAAAYLAQHLIVLLDPADIVLNLHHAYRRAEFRTGHYASFHTGPSATADIEGVLIHGAQGVRSLSVLPLARHGP